MSNAQIEKKILIVDDEVELGEALKDILSADFDQVDFVSDSTKAVQMIEQNNYTLILSDYKMPGLTGLDLVTRIRSLGLLTTIIWISGYVDKQMALNAVRLGVIDIIEKPVNAYELSKFIFRAYDIERRKAALIKDTDDNPNSRKMLGLLYASDNRIHKSRASHNGTNI
jgi:DNA-binding NtrC family response regulator